MKIHLISKFVLSITGAHKSKIGPFAYPKTFFLLFLFLTAYSVDAQREDFYSAEGGPDLIVYSADSRLERGRVGTVSVVLENQGAVVNLVQESVLQTEDQEMLAMLEQEMEMEASKAVGIKSLLKCGDENLHVLSGPQLGGSLASGQRLNEPLNFSIQVDENATAGNYPLSLVVDYEQQKNVRIGGNPLYPEIYFQRESSRKNLDLNVLVIQGPTISTEFLRGDVPLGRESSMKFLLTNLGDEPAQGVQAELISEWPFNWTEDVVYVGDLAPGQSVTAEFPVHVDGAADLGDYALICRVVYNCGQEVRTNEQVALVGVTTPKGISTIFIIPALAIFLTFFYLSGLGKRLTVFFKYRRRKRW